MTRTYPSLFRDTVKKQRHVISRPVVTAEAKQVSVEMGDTVILYSRGPAVFVRDLTPEHRVANHCCKFQLLSYFDNNSYHRQKTTPLVSVCFAVNLGRCAGCILKQRLNR